MKRTPAFVAALCVLSSMVHAELTMTATPTIEGFMPTNGPMPVTVEFDNDGPDARGVLRVTGQSFRTDYPIEVPNGGKKRLVVYPQMDWGETTFVLLSNQGRLATELRPERNWVEPGQQVILCISDAPGEMIFLRNKNQGNNGYRPNQLSMQDAYCVPSRCPDRPVGYAGIGAVVLGPGAERLTDREVEALKLWSIAGGTLVFLGGASAPILNDPRWRNVLPAGSFRTINTRSPLLAKLGGFSLPEISITTGQPAASANANWDGGNLISAERQFGVGRVLYLSFNPLEAPLNRWEGRKAAFTKLVRPAELNGRRAFVTSYSREAQGMNSGMPTAILPSGAPAPARAVPQEDPFSTKLPPANKVFLVLGLYFIVVVPINFVVLKRLNRGELAWFSAPVISLAFAGVLFTQAQELYAAQMSSASQGILVAQQGVPEGMFIGTSQVFIPRGGSYDLRLEGVDSVGVVEDQDNYYSPYRNRPATLELDPIDDGEVHVPAMRANNLAFRQITYREREQNVGDWIRIRHVPGSTSYEVENQSPYDLKDGLLYLGKLAYRLKASLSPGERSRIEIGAKTPEAWDMTQGVTLTSVLTSNSLVVSGRLQGFRPGPQLGKVVEPRTRIQLVYVSSEASR